MGYVPDRCLWQPSNMDNENQSLRTYKEMQRGGSLVIPPGSNVLPNILPF